MSRSTIDSRSHNTFCEALSAVARGWCSYLSGSIAPGLLAVVLVLPIWLVLSPGVASAAAETPFGAGRLTKAGSVAVDNSTGKPSSGRVYVSNGDEISVFEPSGEYLFGFGPGTSGSVAVDNAAGAEQSDVYVYTGTSVRKFDPEGHLLLAFGGDVVASGPDNTTNNLHQIFTLVATGGEFGLIFEGQETGELPYNATAAQLEVALNALPTIGGAGGSVTVTGGPGGTSATPYQIAFGGALASRGDVPMLQWSSHRDNIGGHPFSFSGGGWEVCKPASGDVCQEGAPGTGPGQLNSMPGLTVDSSGDVWVGGSRFEASGTFLSTYHVPFEHGIALTPNDDYYGYFTGNRGSVPGEVLEFDSGGSQLGVLSLVEGLQPVLNVQAIATDPSGDLFVVESSESGVESSGAVKCFSGLFEYNPVGELVKRWDIHGRPPNAFFCTSIYYAFSMAFGSAGDDLYILWRNHDALEAVVVTVPPPGPLPREGGESVSTVGSVVATLHAFVDPEGKSTTTRFQYVTQEAFEHGGYSSPEVKETPVSGSIGSDFGEYETSSVAEGLKPETTYHYRVVATSSEGTTYGEDETFTSAPAASFSVLPIEEPGRDTAKVSVLVNANGLQTKVWLEYGSGSVTEHTTSPVSIEGFQSSTVSMTLAELVPGTAYHLRAIAENTAGRVEGPEESFTTAGRACPNETLRSGFSARLPDCRAFEQVSPVEKNGQNITANVATRADGEAVAYATLGALPGSPSAMLDYYRAVRGSEGWHSEPLAPPTSTVSLEALYDTMYVPDVSSDLSSAVVQTAYPLNPQEQGISGDEGVAVHPLQDYLREPNGTFTWLSAPEVLPDTSPQDTVFEGASPDLDYIVFNTAKSLTPLTRDSTARNLYVWSRGKIQVINTEPGKPDVLMGGGALLPSETHKSAGNNTGRLEKGVALGSPEFPTDVSEGGTVFFNANNGLYAWHNGETEEVSRSQRAGSVGQPATGAFEVASSDGSKVIFSSDQQLTDGASQGRGYYEYDLGTKRLAYVGPVHLGSSPQEFSMVLGANSDLSYVYVVQGSEIVVLHDGTETRVVQSTGAPHDVFEYGQPQGPGILNEGVASPDGRYLAFMATANLTGYPSNGHAEIYEYDAVNGTLRCASCRADGSAPEGEATLYPQRFVLDENQGRVPQAVSDDGRVFFNTTDGLVGRDQNHQEDVYEYENGMLYLLSSGTSTAPSEFFGASEDGSNVFLLTYQSLVPQDTDGGVADVYDVRIDGGFAAPAPVGVCGEETCREATSLTPPFGGVASALLTGSSGNFGALAPGASKPTPRGLTSAEKLARALRVCRRVHAKRKRVACETKARRRYRVARKAGRGR